MGTDLEAILPYGKHGIDKFRQRVAAADGRQRGSWSSEGPFDRNANVMLPRIR